ncbi:zinc finger protein 385D-like isoform X1 [Acipenser oxyrinchus oxyrinchus]|uniref:Zinc finger protein 385D-like isoform X1 n=1 Tax=Acipenser oxyrinchus oxyrinchus TaxID=40147 RepID=A0AAD8GFU5_ACIOX|nr:zinc finger protein 385D-like isoform X1 [Acipenser oxyrinchus oxyrinchus]
MGNSMYFGSTCQNAVLPALVRPPFPPVQPTLDLKPFLPFPLDTAVNLFPNFNASLVGISSRTDQFQPFGSWKAGISASQLCVSMDPVQKAVINHTFGVPPKRKHIIPCNICQLRFNSESQASAHYKGTKHAKKLKAWEAPKKKQKAAATKDSAKTTFTIITTSTINTSTDRTDSTTGIPLLRLSTTTAAEPAAALTNCSVQTSTETTLGANKKEVASIGSNSCLPMETEDEKAKRLLYCSLCKVAVNSASQLEAHNSGTKHITMLEARSGSGTIKAFPRPAIKGKVASTTKAITGLQNKTFHCEVCNVHVNSETQLKQHISSRRHKDRAAGKPPKPKYSPYNKAQRGTTAHAVKLTLRKEPGKTLTPRILPNHIRAAAMTAAASAVGSPFALRSTPAGALFQAQALSPALLRPAPGPIRTPHTPVLFAPY